MKKRVTLTCLMLLVCLFLTACSASEEAKKYKKASEYFENQSYASALPLFKELASQEEPYKDSAEKANECLYEIAVGEMENDMHEKAVKSLERLVASDENTSISKKAKEKLKECYYEIGEVKLSHKDYDTAKAFFLKAKDYADSAAKAQECDTAKQEKYLAYAERTNTNLESYGISTLDDLIFDSIVVSDYSRTDTVYVSSSAFNKLTNPDKLTVIETIANVTGLIAKESVHLDCDGMEYSATNKDRSMLLTVNGEEIYERLCIDSPAYISYSADSSGKKRITCPTCNGTGYAKFYYGDNDLEAYLNGHDPEWYDICPMCNGTGKVEE